MCSGVTQGGAGHRVEESAEQHKQLSMAHLAQIAQQSMETVLRGYAQGLLAQVAQDYNLDNQELIRRYLEAPSPQATIKNGDGVPAPLLVLAQQEKTKKKRATKEKPEKQCCKGITAKGQPCKFAALADGFCKKHSEQEKKKNDPAPPKTARKPEKPRHTHLVEEEPLETCQVCENQGNVTRPEMPRQDFEIEGADEIKERLRKMLADAEETEEPEETTEKSEETEEPEESEESEETTEKSEETVPISELMGEETEEEQEEDDMESRLKAILAEESEDEDEEEQ